MPQIITQKDDFETVDYGALLRKRIFSGISSGIQLSPQ